MGQKADDDDGPDQKAGDCRDMGAECRVPNAVSVLRMAERPEFTELVND